MKKLYLLLAIFIALNSTYAQINDSLDFEERPKSINEVIVQVGNDSVIFFYNDKWELVKPICATKFRIIRIDPVSIEFAGPFVDYYMDSIRASEGNYTKGKKEGYFKLYFPNGRLDQAGNYSNDKKEGTWQYFYENGHKKQIFEFTNDEILIMEFWDESGKQLVTAGNGEWTTYESNSKFMKISGTVLNGRMHGTWKKTIPSQKITMNVEKYEDGKFKSGKLNSVGNGSFSYKDNPYCFIEKELPFLTAEKFRVNQCYRVQNTNWEFAKYPGGVEGFYREIDKKLVLTPSIYVRGIIRVETTIDINGKMTDFRPLSNIGYEYDLIRVLETMSNWTPTKLNGVPTTQSKIISIQVL
jgi:hypothetical protein